MLSPKEIQNCIQQQRQYPLSISDRIRAYEYAKEVVNHYWTNSPYNALVCPAISSFYKRITGEQCWLPFEESFPEWAAQYPHYSPAVIIWWPLTEEGFRERYAALDRAIELCQQKIREEKL